VFRLQGWVVRATKNIAKNTLICEYAGITDIARHHLFIGDDDLLDLLKAQNSRNRYLDLEAFVSPWIRFSTFNLFGV
jgi:hypothetical protein